MTSPAFPTSEAGGPQLQAIHTLANLGWRYLSRAEGEVQRRGRLGETLLEDVLTERLRALNVIEQRGRAYPVTDAAVAEAIGRLKAATGDTSAGLLGANAAATDIIQLGTSIPITIEGETRGRQLRFIDWERLDNNVFHVTAEFAVERARSIDTRRPDIVLFINGIPLAIIEVKASQIEAKQGVSQQIRNQGSEEIPRLFATTQLLVAANPSEPLYATVGTPAKFWALWREKEIAETEIAAVINRRLPPAEAAAIFADFAPHRRRHEGLMEAGGRLPTALDETLVGLLSPERLLTLVRGFTLFDAGAKKVARYQQFFGVRKALERLSQFDERERRRGGVIWHTQGSGKSLTMAMLARAIADRVPNRRIILVTDRRDLDRQIRDNFRATGLVVHQAESGRDLARLVENKAEIVTTLIHKFKAALRSRDLVDESRDVFLLVDESHRSQAIKDDESLHRQMRRVFPNACYIGFTGTPLLKKERSTFDRFGGLIDRYAIDEAVRDKAVVPLLYEGRHVETELDQGAIDRWFERTVKGLSDAQIADLKRKMSRGREVHAAEPRLRVIAFDVSEDFARNWKGTPFKAQLVAPSQRAAVILKELLDEFGEVTSEVVIAPSDDREGHEEVDEEPSEEVARFWKRVKTQYGTPERYEEAVIERFKGPDAPEIVIVVDKLLTGFDAPRNRVLYLAKPLRDHGLLQAIARVNRLYEDDETGVEKDFGHVIDYAGVLGELDRALTAYSALEGYAEADVAEALVSIREKTESLPDLHASLLDLFKGIRNAGDQEEYERLLADELLRDDFYARLRAYAKALALAFSSEDFLQGTDARTLAGYKADLKRFENLRRSAARRYADVIDFAEHEARIRKLLDRHISATDVVPIVAPVNIFDEAAFRRTVAEETGSTASKADAIASATARTVTERMDEDPVFYKRFSDLVRQTIEEFRAGRLSEKDYLDKIIALRNQVVNRSSADEAIPTEVRNDDLASALYRNTEPLLKDVIGNDVSSISAQTAAAFAAIVRRHRKIGWQADIDVQNEIRNAMDDFLYDEVKGKHGIYALDAATMDRVIDNALAIARRQAAS